MKKRNLIFGLFLSSGLVMVGAAALSNAGNKTSLEVRADTSPNDMFSYIYNDTYNNLNGVETLFVFAGVAPGLTERYTLPDVSKIFVNGVDLGTLEGSAYIWEGQNWLGVRYPAASAYDGATLEIKSGIAVGDSILAGAKFKMDSSLKWSFDGFNDEPTATFTKIPYPDFAGNNQLLLQYTGNGTLGGGEKTTTEKNIHNYDRYVTINGNPLSSDANGKILAWGSEQPWLYLKFSAVSVGDVLRIEKGMRFYTEVFDSMIFVFNGTVWEYVSYIADDPLIQNNDFVLFSPSDYNFGGPNTGWGFFTSNGRPVADLDGHKNFGIQFTFQTIDDGTGYFQIKIGNEFISDSFLLFTYYNKKVYVEKIMGAVPSGAGDASIDLGDTQEHLLELYVIKDSNSTVQIIFGSDGKKIYKSPSLDFTGATEWDYISLQSVEGNCTQKFLIGSSATTTTEAIDRFYNRRLASPVGDTWAEKFAYVNEYYNNYLNSAQRTAMAQQSAYDYANRAYTMIKAEADAEALNAYKAAAKTELENYKDLNDYFPEDQLTVDDIISNGKGFIDDATTTDGVDAVVATYKDLLDGVKTEAQRKTAAKTELENYKDPNDYYPDEQQDIADIVALGKTQIDACTTLTDVNTTLAGAKGNLDNLQTKDQKDLAAAKNAAIEELNDIDAQKYYPDERMQVNNIRNQAIEDISDATTVAEITTLKDNALAAIAEIPTALEKAIAGAKEELGSYVNLEDYRADDQTRINNILTNAYAQLDHAESLDEVSDIVAGNKELLDAVPTDAERTAAELAEYKTEKKSWLDEQKTTLLPDYREAEQQLITSYVADAKTQIDDASDKGGVDAAITAMQDKIALLKTDAQYNQQEADEVIALISAIPTLTPANYVASESSITSARSAYDALGDGAKALVSNYAALQAAEARLAELKGEAAAAAQVDALVSAIGDVTLDSETAINAARTAYNALNAEAQGMVKNLSVLTAAEARLAELKQAKSDAEAVEAKINAIGTVDASGACKNKINEARTAYNALSADAKAMVSNLSTLEAAESAFALRLNEAKEAGKAEVDEIAAGINMKKYSQDNKELISTMISDAKSNIDGASNSEEITSIIETLQANLETIPQKKAPAKKGCGGSIVATSVVLSTLALAGLGLAISKKRKED